MSFIISLLIGRGLAPLAAKAIVYAVIAAIVGGALLTIRQHYVNLGWEKHKVAVEKQDNKAIEASKEVQQRTDKCSTDNGFWDVITQGCKMQEGDSK